MKSEKIIFLSPETGLKINKFLYIIQFLLVSLLFSGYFKDGFNTPKLIVMCFIIPVMVIVSIISGTWKIRKDLLYFSLILLGIIGFRELFLRDSSPHFFFLFIVQFILLVLYISVLTEFIAEKHLKVLLYSGYIVSLLSVFQFLGWNFTGFILPDIFQGKKEIYSTIGNPNFLAGFLLTLIPLSHYFRKIEKNNLLVAGEILLVTALFLTRCYAGIIIFLMSCLIYLIYHRKLKTLWMGFMILIVLISLFLGGSRLKGKFLIRRILYESVAGMIKENALWGFGKGNFSSAYIESQGKWAENREKNKLSVNRNLFRQYLTAHNEFIDFLLEFGLIPFLCALVGVFHTLRKKREDRSFLSLKIGMMLVLIHSLFSPLFNVIPILLVLATYISFFYYSDNKNNFFFPKNRIMEGILIVFVCLIPLLGFVLFKSEYHLQFARADAYYSRFYESVKNTEISLKWNPLRNENLLIQGDAYYKLKEYQKAIESYNKGFNYQFDIDSMLKWADSHFTVKEYDKTWKIIDKILYYRVSPTFEIASLIAGTMKMQKGEYRWAIHHFSNSGEDSRGLYSLSWCLMQMKYYESAEKVYSRLLQFYPGNEEFYYFRGICRFYLNKMKTAREDFQIIRNNLQSQWYFKVSEYIMKIDNLSIKDSNNR